ncbi:unnamed protein product [Rotaria sp. Silwood1]|nr:unnamed protein product [Rotaria sp. Silwood1]
MINKEKSDDTASSSTATRPKYNTKERVCTTISESPTHRLDIEDLFSNPSDSKDKPNLDILKQHILLEGRLTEQAALRIIESAIQHFPSEASVIYLEKTNTCTCEPDNRFTLL